MAPALSACAGSSACRARRSRPRWRISASASASSASSRPRAWQLELVTTMQPGQHARRSAATPCASTTSTTAQVENYVAETGQFTVTAPGGGDAAGRRPSGASIPRAARPTTEAAIETYGFSQLYLQLGEQGADGSHVVRVWYKPYVTLIWLGAILMALAGFLSLTDRRLRVGAPRRGGAPSRRRPNESCSPRFSRCSGLALPAFAVNPERDAGRSGARGAGAGDLRGAALPRLPERVDRRQRRRSRPRNPRAGARAADGGRYR